jgi:hypothetical protein
LKKNFISSLAKKLMFIVTLCHSKQNLVHKCFPFTVACYNALHWAAATLQPFGTSLFNPSQSLTTTTHTHTTTPSAKSSPISDAVCLRGFVKQTAELGRGGRYGGTSPGQLRM